MPQNQSPNVRLKAAVHSVEVPPFLDAKIRRSVEESRLARPRRWTNLALAGAAAGFVFSVGIAYQLGHLRIAAGEQESYIASVSTRVAALMRVGLGDHLHCAFFRKFPQQAPAVEEMESGLGSEYKDLIPLVQKVVPAQFKLSLGHLCRYQGRQFVHLVLKNDERLLSLVITAKEDGESFHIEGMLPELVQAGVPVYSGGAQRFQIAAMETSGHLVYFVSDLPGTQNMEVMRAMAPSVKRILEAVKG